MHAVDPVLVVQVRAGNHAGRTDVADDLALFDARADALPAAEIRHVRIQCRDIAAVLQDDDVAVAALAAAENDLAVAGGHDRRAGRCRVIDTAVCANRIQHRVAPVRVER